MSNHDTPRIKRLQLTVQRASRSTDQPSDRQIRQWLRAALNTSATITVRFVDRREGHQLNLDYRHKDYATNVLTFSYDCSTKVQGDLVLCAPVVREEARQQGKTPMHHYAHLIIHGALHLQGHDHELESEARVMEQRETEILAKFQIADPYAEVYHHG
jgi:probable rRNA maturation factor